MQFRGQYKLLACEWNGTLSNLSYYFINQRQGLIVSTEKLDINKTKWSKNVAVAGREKCSSPVFLAHIPGHLAIKQMELIRVAQCFLWVDLGSLFKQSSVKKVRLKYVKEKHGPAPQQLLSTKAMHSGLHKAEVWIWLILFTVQLLLGALIGIMISLLFRLMKRLPVKERWCSNMIYN